MSFNNNIEGKILDKFFKVEEGRYVLKTSEELNEKTSSIKDGATKEDELVSTEELIEDTEELQEDTEITLEDFKAGLSKNKKMKKLVSKTGFDEVFKMLDTNNDDKISTDELKVLGSNKTDLGDVKYKEMKKFIEEYETLDEEDFKNLVSKLKDELGIKSETPALLNPATGAAIEPSNLGFGVNTVTGGAQGYPSGGGGFVSYSSTPAASLPKLDTEQTIEELEAEKTKREETLTTAKESLNTVLDESEADIKAKKDDMEDKKEKYDKALSEDAKQNPKLQKLKDDKDENDDLIKENEKNTKETETNLTKTEQDINEKENLIENLNSELTSLNSTLSDLQGIEVTEENQSEIQEKIASVQSQIEAKQKEIDKEEAALDKLNKEKDKLDEELKKLQKENEELVEKRDDLEDEIEKTASDAVKAALKEYQTSRNDFENLKTEKKQTAKEEVNNAQISVNEINTKITELKNKETAKENGMASVDAMKNLETLKSTGGDAWNGFGNLCASLNMNEEQTMEYLTNLCYSEQYGAGVIDPVTLCAQICQESGYNPSIVGDNGSALGFGQFHKCAVDEVNNQYGTNYTYDDRANPTKALEMMTLLLKYDYKHTGSTEGMLAMYNQGHAGAINTSGGQKYLRDIYSRL